MSEVDKIWIAKLAAWTHDPAEKALVLFRDALGHEGGTVQRLRGELFPQGLPGTLLQAVRKADHWASAADRPQFPRKGSDGPFADWAQAHFDREPVLIHPLSADPVPVEEGFSEDPEHLKAVSIDHFSNLIHRNEDGKVDHRRTALAFWRFGPEAPASGLGALWGLLPADTRVPDHSIWAHLDLTSALAGAFCSDADGTPALLLMSFGPVQDFIAQSRSTSDLWAGSHLLSRMAWEAIKVVCSRTGPDSILFPQLRGVPAVDLWLQGEEGLREDLFQNATWRRSRSDSNPLFVAALPNRFVGLVPAGQAPEIAIEVTKGVREWVLHRAHLALEHVAEAAGTDSSKDVYAWTQIEQQLQDFPKVHWAAVPWSLIGEAGGGIDASALQSALKDFFPPGKEEPGFLGSDGWRNLQSEKRAGDWTFFKPNPGVLYPALYDLLDRVHGAGKSLRPFLQLPQAGYRCSLCGEREWLAARQEDLHIPPGERRNTLWAKASERGKSWARKGEHLCAPCSLKRLWPRLFLRKEVSEHVENVNRYVVSTHTMALCTSLEIWLKHPTEERAIPVTDWTSQVLGGKTFAALPRKLEGVLRDEPENVQHFVKGLPVFLDELRDKALGSDPALGEQADKVLDDVEKGVERLFGKKPEAYYALILMDGDRMGAWISGSEDDYRKPYERFWHPKISKAIDERAQNDVLSKYLKTLRPSSPARHMAISGALNAFALALTRYVLEDLYKGKLIYAGGDDVLAMICIDDLLPAMQTLRLCYSGVFPEGEAGEHTRQLLGLPSSEELKIGKGHVWLHQEGRRTLLRTMGRLATASIGAVVAHHMAPLNRVLRVLRQAEKRAKQAGGRNAFAVDVLKRGGGAIQLTCPWGPEEAESLPTAMEPLIELRNLMAQKRMSRRAVYLAQEWSRHLPSEDTLRQAGGSGDDFRSMLEKTLARQFRRQATSDEAAEAAARVAKEIVELALEVQGRTGRNKLTDFIVDYISVAEFLAREGRVELSLDD